MTTELSPAAQAVLDAADEVFSNAGTTRQGLAAALRAAAEELCLRWQVVLPVLEEEFFDLNYSLPLQQKVETRRKLLAIAAELDGANSTS